MAFVVFLSNGRAVGATAMALVVAKINYTDKVFLMSLSAQLICYHQRTSTEVSIAASGIGHINESSWQCRNLLAAMIYMVQRNTNTINLLHMCA